MTLVVADFFRSAIRHAEKVNKVLENSVFPLMPRRWTAVLPVLSPERKPQAPGSALARYGVCFGHAGALPAGGDLFGDVAQLVGPAELCRNTGKDPLEAQRASRCHHRLTDEFLGFCHAGPQIKIAAEIPEGGFDFALREVGRRGFAALPAGPAPVIATKHPSTMHFAGRSLTFESPRPSRETDDIGVA